ncbi:MAG: hypothetical protein Pars2KO_30000 [Parasphingorhabdus sp.]
MMSLNRIINRIASDDDGATLMEFALIAGPLMLILFGIIDLGYKGYTDTLIKAEVHKIARDASTGEMTYAQIEQQIADNLEPILLKESEVDVDVRSYFDFTSIGKPEKLTTDVNNNGEVDPGDCYIDSNNNDVFDTNYGQSGTGGPDDIVSYEITVTSPRLFPLPQLFGASEQMIISSSTAVRNQPFGAQVDLVETCISDLD